MDGDPTVFVEQRIDPDEEFRKQVEDVLKKKSAEFATAHTENMHNRCKRDFFFALFYGYKEFNMDESLQGMLTFLEETYLEQDETSVFVRETFEEVLAADPQDANYGLLKVFLACVIIGREKSIRVHVQQMCDKDATVYRAPEVVESTKRLLTYLPIEVEKLTQRAWNVLNIEELVIGLFVWCAHMHANHCH